MKHFTETDGGRARCVAVEHAAEERHRPLLNDREGAGAFYLAAREIAERHIEQLQKIDTQRELPTPHYTAKEVAQIETFAAKQKDEESRTIYEETVRTAVADGRVGYAKSNQPKQTQQELTHDHTQTAESPPEQGRSASEHDQGSTTEGDVQQGTPNK